MAKAIVAPPSPRRRARALPFLLRKSHSFFRLLGTTPTKTAACRHRLAARSIHSRRVARLAEPKRSEAEEEPQELAAGSAPYPDADADAAVAGKYWAHRHSLFSLYDRGVRMDAEGWYSATPESIAASQAARAAPGDVVVDAFAGCGGNAIQFAARGCEVVAVEIDPQKVELAKHNARVYGVEDKIQFIVGDFFQLAPFLKADLVFLSPPWGGPSYIQAPIYTLDMLMPKDGMPHSKLLRR